MYHPLVALVCCLWIVFFLCLMGKIGKFIQGKTILLGCTSIPFICLSCAYIIDIILYPSEEQYEVFLTKLFYMPFLFPEPDHYDGFSMNDGFTSVIYLLCSFIVTIGSIILITEVLVRKDVTVRTIIGAVSGFVLTVSRVITELYVLLP